MADPWIPAVWVVSGTRSEAPGALTNQRQANGELIESVSRDRQFSVPATTTFVHDLLCRIKSQWDRKYLLVSSARSQAHFCKIFADNH